ncbi:hypothetical protein ACTL6U_04430 [Rhodovibrionaceae bacterium A322]
MELGKPSDLQRGPSGEPLDQALAGPACPPQGTAKETLDQTGQEQGSFPGPFLHQSRRWLRLPLTLLALNTLVPSQVLANPEDDLQVIFKWDDALPAPGGIAGRVINTSPRVYECIDLVFRLIYSNSSNSNGPAELSITVQDLQPDSTTHYSAPLQQRAGFGLKEVKACEPAQRPDPVPDAATCHVTGSVSSTMDFTGLDDRGTEHRIRYLYLLDQDGDLVSRTEFSATGQTSKTTSGHTRKTQFFEFVRLPANHRYRLQLDHAWRMDPSFLTFTCPNDRGQRTFSLPRLTHTGNRLGG